MYILNLLQTVPLYTVPVVESRSWVKNFLLRNETVHSAWLITLTNHQVCSI